MIFPNRAVIFIFMEVVLLPDVFRSPTDKLKNSMYLAAHAKDMGQDYIPVHIFPVNFDNPRSVAYLNRFLVSFNEFVPFEKSMQNAFYYFEKNHQVPPVVM